MEKEYYPKIEDFREIIAKLTADRETFRKILEAHKKQDVESFQEILKKLEFPPRHFIWICRFICWLECTVYCEIRCSMFGVT